MVECESCCQWSHSKCVGLTFSTAPSYPFVCPFCVRSLFSRLSAIESEVADLSTRVSSLESTLNNQGQSLTKDIQAVTDSLRKVSRQVDPLLSNMPSKDAVGKSHTRTNPLGRSPVRNGSVSESRKGNVVLSGIPECPHGTPRLDRFVRDQDSAVSILSSVCSSITSQSIKDLFRLGSTVLIDIDLFLLNSTNVGMLLSFSLTSSDWLPLQVFHYVLTFLLLKWLFTLFWLKNGGTCCHRVTMQRISR